MSLPVVTLVQKIAMLNAITEAAAAWDQSELRLFQNDYDPLESMDVADFTEADFDGYAAQTITAFEAAYKGEDGYATVYADGLYQFDCTGDTTPNTIYGYYVVGDPGGTPFLAFAERFDTPVAVLDALDAVVVAARAMIRTNS